MADKLTVQERCERVLREIAAINPAGLSDVFVRAFQRGFEYGFEAGLGTLESP